jgi:hypothetical protein
MYKATVKNMAVVENFGIIFDLINMVLFLVFMFYCSPSYISFIYFVFKEWVTARNK